LCLSFEELLKTFSTSGKLGSCDFEQAGFCEWRQVHDGHDDFDWLTNSGETSSEQTGPRFDHTTESELGSVLALCS
jgi:exonuclease III